MITKLVSLTFRNDMVSLSVELLLCSHRFLHEHTIHMATLPLCQPLHVTDLGSLISHSQELEPNPYLIGQSLDESPLGQISISDPMRSWELRHKTQHGPRDLLLPRTCGGQKEMYSILKYHTERFRI